MSTQNGNASQATCTTHPTMFSQAGLLPQWELEGFYTTTNMVWGEPKCHAICTKKQTACHFANASPNSLHPSTNTFSHASWLRPWELVGFTPTSDKFWGEPKWHAGLPKMQTACHFGNASPNSLHPSKNTFSHASLLPPWELVGFTPTTDKFWGEPKWHAVLPKMQTACHFGNASPNSLHPSKNTFSHASWLPPWELVGFTPTTDKFWGQPK